MSPDIKIQFYVFDDQHFAIPFSIKKHPLWQPTVDLVSNLANCSVITQETLNWEDIPRIIVLLSEMEHLHHEDTYKNLVNPATGALYPLRYVKSAPELDIHTLQRLAEEAKAEEKEESISDRRKELYGLIAQVARKHPTGPNFDELMLKKACPIIMIGTEDIMWLFAEKPGEDIAKNPLRYQYRLELDARLKFWDSGIWYRYVPLEGRHDSEAAHFKLRFERVFEKIRRWWEQGLYATFVALENLEFQTRVMLNSFIAEIGHHGHEDRVTPFKFHSETEMECMSEDLIKELTFKEGCLIEKYQWQLLLVDDYANKPLSSVNKACKVSKMNLIEAILHEGLVVDSKDEEKKTFKVVPPEPTEEEGPSNEIIAKCFQRLTEKTYDIILLDYLLGIGKLERNGREYGYDFLRDILYKFNNGKQNTLHKGPLGRFWIFPISSFPFAFADKLRQLGMDGYSDHWHLSDGGDPVCTPALFRYNFLNFIKQQITECYLFQHALIDFFNRFDNIQNGILWRDLILNSITQIHLRKSILENDETQHSLFAEKMLSFVRNERSYKKILDTLRSFVTNITDIPYFRIKDSLSALKDSEELVKILTEKSALFFRPEKKLEEKIKNHLDGGNTFDFNGERLRWLPADIKKLINVKVLRLSNNQLTTLPQELTALTGLRQLDLSYNALEALPDNLKDLNALEYLDLSGNLGLPEYLRTKHEGKAEIAELFTNAASWNRERRKKVVVSYASQDKDGLLELEKTLKPLEREGLISLWTDDRIMPGEKWDSEIPENFMQADIVLLLVSKFFLASDYIYNVEMNIAIKRQSEKLCHIVPIILKDCDWQYPPLNKFQGLPKGIRPVYSANRPNPDEAWKEISEGIRQLIAQGKLR